MNARPCLGKPCCNGKDGNHDTRCFCDRSFACDGRRYRFRGRHWPGWLGPNRDGKSPDTGLLKEWPDDGPKLLWKADGIGVGFSSVAVAGGKVYITGDQDGKLMLFAFDAGRPAAVEGGARPRPRRARRLAGHAGDRQRKSLPAQRPRPGRLLRRQTAASRNGRTRPRSSAARRAVGATPSRC